MTTAEENAKCHEAIVAIVGASRAKEAAIAILTVVCVAEGIPYQSLKENVRAAFLGAKKRKYEVEQEMAKLTATKETVQ